MLAGCNCQRPRCTHVIAVYRRESEVGAFPIRALKSGPSPVEVTTDRARVYRECSTSSSRPRGMSWSSSRTPAWKLITADSTGSTRTVRPGIDFADVVAQCQGY